MFCCLLKHLASHWQAAANYKRIHCLSMSIFVEVVYFYTLSLLLWNHFGSGVLNCEFFSSPFLKLFIIWPLAFTEVAERPGLLINFFEVESYPWAIRNFRQTGGFGRGQNNQSPRGWQFRVWQLSMPVLNPPVLATSWVWQACSSDLVAFKGCLYWL